MEKGAKMFLIIGIVLIVLILFIIYGISFPIGPGTQFVFEVKEGCNKINENKQNEFDLNFTLTDELLDTVIVEYGYPAGGLKTGTLREFCQRYKDIENCKNAVASYCLGR